MNSESEYRRWAAACLDLGKRAAELTDRTRLLVIAEAWLDLANRVGRAIRRGAGGASDAAEHPLVTTAFGSNNADTDRAAPSQPLESCSGRAQR
jgi:hypothetical protein